MIIRGIDFARHTVVVGNDSESPAPQAPGQPALQGRGDLAARVIASSGGEATLEINGQRVVVETHVPLNVGDKLFVRIQAPEVEGQAIRLQILANEPDQGEPPSAALKGEEVDTLLDDLSSVDFDDMGTSVNVDIGFLNDPDALCDGQDVSTAAGNVKLMKSVTIANRTKPLWALAGYASKQAAIDAGYEKATVTLTFVDANPASGSLAWHIYGSPQ